MLNNDMFIQGFNAVDLDFGPDGAMYISEYNYGGWEPESQGAVYRLMHPVHGSSNTVKDNEVILTSGFNQYSNDKLLELIKNKQEILLTLTQDNDERVRADALSKLFKQNPEAGLTTARRFLQSNITADRQIAYKVLVNGNDAEIDAIAMAAIKQLNVTKQTDGETLALIDFVRSRNTAEVKAELVKYNEYLAQADIMTQYASSMYGGIYSRRRRSHCTWVWHHCIKS
jgi:hypothetical protein